MAIVTISRELGSDGTQIAEGVAAQLGAIAVDKEVLAQMAKQAGVSIEVITHAEEQLLSRPVAVSDEMRALMSARRGDPLNQAHFVHLMSEAIKLLVAQDNVVFVGRGAQIILKDQAGALHVHLYAPAQVRAARIQQRRSLPNVETALRVIQQVDEQRRNWFRHFFSGVDWKSTKHYHLMIDTGRIPAAVATALIVEAARA
jgi:cytidylate kinase